MLVNELRLKNNMLPFLKLSCKTLFFLFFTFFVTCGYAQEKHTISGYITALASGEALSNAKVYVPSVNKGALTNTYGFYSLTLPAGIYEIEFRYTSFPTVRKTIDLSGKDVAINVELGFKDGEKVFEEVVVNGKKGEKPTNAAAGLFHSEKDVRRRCRKLSVHRLQPSCQKDQALSFHERGEVLEHQSDRETSRSCKRREVWTRDLGSVLSRASSGGADRVTLGGYRS